MKTSRNSILPSVVFALLIAPAVCCFAQDDRRAGYITLQVPEEATVFVNGNRTQTTGSRRRYVSYLRPGLRYRFRFRVELQRGNQTLEATDIVLLAAGETANLSFNRSQFAARTTTRKPPLPQPEQASPKKSEPDAAEVRDLAMSDDVPPTVPPRDTRTPRSLPPTPPRRPVPPQPKIPRYTVPIVQQYLNKVQFPNAEEELESLLKESPDDNELRFSLAATEFLSGVDELLHALYRHGLQNKTANIFFVPIQIPFLRLRVPANASPEPISYQKARAILQAFADRMEQAELTLAGMDAGEFQLPVDIIPLGFDVDRNDVIDQTLWDVFKQVNPRARLSQDQHGTFVVFFDRSDAYWLQGYCNLLKAMAEVALAHDFEELFHRCGYLFFEKAETPYKALQVSYAPRRYDLGGSELEVLAVVHAVNLPIAEPKRMQQALEHLEKTLALSRKMWASIVAETDDLREWIPGPKQTSIFPNLRVTQTILHSWLRFLDETEKILAGKKLLPLWNEAARDKGINLRRVFTEPRTFDLFGWYVGFSAAPYLETGEKTDPQVWRRLRDVLGGQLVSFAVWVN